MTPLDATTAGNPLLDFNGLPDFASITPAHVGPAVEQLVTGARATIEEVVAVAGGPTWDTFVRPLADSVDQLDQSWGQVGHLNAVVNTPALRETYNANLPKITAFYTDFGQDERLFARYRALAAGREYLTLDAARRRVIDNALRDFRLAGAELPEAEKAQLKSIDEELAQLAARYEENVLDATDAWELLTEDEAQLAGIPRDVLDAARQTAQSAGKSGWKLTLHMPCYLPVLQ
jgi:oligopeptidase A